MKRFLLVTSAVALLVSPATAANFSFTGAFGADDDVQLFNFSVGAVSTVTLLTYSYAGGTMADGTVVAAGGFDPILALFDGAGLFIDNNDDGSFPDVGVDPVTGDTYDTYFQSTLNPGNYTVAVSQFDNFFLGGIGDPISLGFSEVGNPTFTGDIWGTPGSMFIDVNGDQRTNQWAFDILNVGTASQTGNPVPEPGTLCLLGSGLLGLVVYGGYRRRA